ncbi:SRPBCC family protein [Riemerella anatipestifer]|uniref:SRPBCC family protein n=1 Tax=Riemerella anatipestifer TaxID=34085 RepID=A0AAP3ANA5_RIEAN|nr:orotate phosphoribosyltransferase [Riemerella anatipestifer]AZZ59614.1 orotate phosphoribosyltransferase [Riemerella anatipestifer]MBT0572219.1 SRPBCC family protein [Riemerella anatipestifer]MCO7318558.1 SRPBCC family protein [Riemerella anatipestifer]MCQ4154809.1 SRPBCC family protein [Riemerella anatipestifer]MCQ4180845.1 SRPBCC family protein [Riemerella anatipestifer]
MNLEGRKIIVNKSAKQLSEMLKRPEDYKELMPEGLKKFETVADGFKFGLKGMPEIALKIDKVKEGEKVVLKSASSSLDFGLTGMMNAINENQTEVQLLFEGKFNPFIKMMVEKPLQNFINNLTDKIEQL